LLRWLGKTTAVSGTQDNTLRLSIASVGSQGEACACVGADGHGVEKTAGPTAGLIFGPTARFITRSIAEVITIIGM
jgi:hypothetical protein